MYFTKLRFGFRPWEPRSHVPLLIAFLCAFACCFASPPHASAAGLLVAEGGFGGVLEIKEQDVRVTINNSIAVTQIDQVFLNTENRQVEALYTFPVPREASVSNFSMWIGGKEMIGEVVEKVQIVQQVAEKAACSKVFISRRKGRTGGCTVRE